MLCVEIEPKNDFGLRTQSGSVREWIYVTDVWFLKWFGINVHLDKTAERIKVEYPGQMNEFHWTIFLQVQTYIKIWSDSKPTFTELPLLRFFNYCSFTFQNIILTWSLSSATIGISVSTIWVNKLAGSELHCWWWLMSMTKMLRLIFGFWWQIRSFPPPFWFSSPTSLKLKINSEKA